MKIYYAHPMSWYGTDREKDDLAVIARDTPLNTEIVNPAGGVYAEQVETMKASGHTSAQIMGMFLGVVASADAIAYRTFDDDYIGAGVAQELLVAALHEKQIFRLLDRSRDLGPMLFEQHGLQARFGPRVLTITQTRDRIRRGIM